jgi:signal transduction histidine kinase
VPITLYADQAQVSRALGCLLRNAIEAAPAQGWAGVRAEVFPSDRLELIVEDNGPGPLLAEREHLFDPFYSGRKAGRGRGLGLPTAWRLARQHGGDVALSPSEPGVTRFVLRLPLPASGERGAEVASPSISPALPIVSASVA